MDSPVAHILHTNCTPSDTQSRQINDYVAERSKDLLRLEDEIAHMLATVDLLSHKRDELKADIDNHRALLSPARRLPREVIQEIFISCLPTTRNAVMSAREAPVLLGQICSVWRVISSSTAELWSSLHVVVPNHPTKAQRKLDIRYDLVKFWLGRSGRCPLSISFVAAEHGSVDSKIVARLIQSLIPFSQRWKIMEFRVPNSSLHFLANLREEDIPILESIKLHHIPGFVPDPPGDALMLGSLSFLATAPRLRSVCFVNFQDDLRALSLPWGRLTELGFEGLFWSAFQLDAEHALDVLRRCPNLTAFSLRLTSSTTHSSLRTLETVSHSRLKFLRITESNDVGSTVFFGRTFLPELRSLEIRGSVTQPFLHSPLPSTLSWLTSPLVSLALDFVSISEDILIEALKLIPSLTTLSINDWAPVEPSGPGWIPRSGPIIGDNLLGLLTLTRENAETVVPLSPALSHITFTQCGAFSDEVLLNFIQSRFESVPAGMACLRHVEISLHRDAELSTIPRVQALREAGLQLSFKQLHPYPGYSDYPWEGITDPLWETSPVTWCVVVP